MVAFFQGQAGNILWEDHPERFIIARSQKLEDEFADP